MSNINININIVDLYYQFISEIVVNKLHSSYINYAQNNFTKVIITIYCKKYKS